MEQDLKINESMTESFLWIYVDLKENIIIAGLMLSKKQHRLQSEHSVVLIYIFEMFSPDENDFFVFKGVFLYLVKVM